MNWQVQLCELNYDHQEGRAVDRIMKSQWLTMGEECHEFEKEFTEFIGHAQTGVFVSSATAALHLILMALNITKGDEVIIPGLTFVSDANTVLQLGAKPILADSKSLIDFNVCAESIISQITPKTKAVIIVHFAGYPMNLTKLLEVCAAQNISVIEDCAHAPGAAIDGKRSGTFGDFSFFSFFSNKNLSVGEGGMAFAKCPDLNQKIRLMRSHGMDSVTIDRHEGRVISYDVNFPGLNYRADEIRGAIGRVQLKKLKHGNLAREHLTKYYIERLREVDVSIPFVDFDNSLTGAYHIMPILLPSYANRRLLMNGMRELGIQTSIHYPNMKQFTCFKGLFQNNEIRNVDEICSRELTLPLHPKMTNDQVDYVVDSLKTVLING